MVNNRHLFDNGFNASIAMAETTNKPLGTTKIKRLVLASASPRRRELLANLDFEVKLAPLKNVDESFPVSLSPEEVAPYISRKKALAYIGEIQSDEILVTADTVVINHGQVIGKPTDASNARHMIASLSGHVHTVVTGVTLLTADGKATTFAESTEVDFAELTPNEIDYYVDNYHPTDKAGAYGIQEWIGYIGIKGIRGDYYNVMGLPMHALYDALKAL